VDVESKKDLTSNKQLRVFNITKFCAKAPRGWNKQGVKNGIAFWNISLNMEIFPKYFMKYFNIKKYRILYITNQEVDRIRVC